MVTEKRLVRSALGVLGVLSLAALTVAASSPPNLAETLAAQQDLAADRPYDAEVHNDHGNLLMLAGHQEEAEQAYRRAIELAPDSALARFNLGILLQQSGRKKDALAEYQRVLEIEPRHARTHYQMGILFHSRNQRTKAMKHYAQAFAFDPELTFPRSNPHIIDNDLATEALLMSRRYSDDLGSVMPRLYGEPERIAELMLKAEESESEPEESEADSETEDSVEAGRRPVERAAPVVEDDEEDSEEEEEDDSDSDSDPEESGERRALTPEDLDVGSSLGRVGGTASGRRPSAGRDTGRATQGRDRRTRVRRPQAEGSGGEADASGKNQGRSVPRYRPAPRLSTGRLELKLLPPEAEPVGSRSWGALETLAQLEAFDQQRRRAHHAVADG